MRWPSQRAVIVSILALGAVRLFTLQFGLDRFTTIELWSNQICSFAGGLSGIAVAAFLARNWFTGEMPVVPRVVQLKQRSPALWAIQGVALPTVAGLAVAWLVASFLGVLAQYLGGIPYSFDAVVVSESELVSARGVCRHNAKVRRESDGSEITICLVTRYRPSLVSAGVIVPGAVVRVDALNTPLGEVVQSIYVKAEGP
jgi:hypothetical protein